MSQITETAVKVESVSKTFKLPHERKTSIKSLFVGMFNGKRTFEKQQVLKNVSFEVKKGEFFGIVGRNGSGKSTLLKLMAGIYAQDKGKIGINGKLVPFIELGVGFNPELTGRENVFLNGALLGFNRKEVEVMYDEIVEFAELEKFMDQKLKNYSSGMQVRLAFSIAILAKGDLLLLDEVLAVGDAAFQQKCFSYFGELKAKKRTVVLVTHDMAAVTRFCTRAMLIENGEIKKIGSPKEIANQYSLDNMNTDHKSKLEKSRDASLADSVKSLSIRAVSPLSLNNEDDFEFEVSYELNKDLKTIIGIAFLYEGRSVIEHNTEGIKLGNKKNTKYRIRYKMPLKYFTPNQYSVDVAIFEEKGFRMIGFNTKSCKFILNSTGSPEGGVLRARGEWEVL